MLLTKEPAEFCYDECKMNSFFDIVDEHDTPLNRIASYKDVHSQGLWVRAAHVIIYTPDKEIVMQKRAPSLHYHPNEVEISAGGGVDAGENPEMAAIREVKEELGIELAESDLRFIGKTKFNHRTKNQFYRNFIYSYAVCLPKYKINIRLNAEETTSAFFISEKKLRKALTKHRIKNIGKISSLYAYWRYLLDAM